LSKPITLKKLNYYRSLALVRRKKNKTTAANTPKKKKKKTIRDRMNAASLGLFKIKVEIEFVEIYSVHVPRRMDFIAQ
jgi:hypothetical protein